MMNNSLFQHVKNQIAKTKTPNGDDLYDLDSGGPTIGLDLRNEFNDMLEDLMQSCKSPIYWCMIKNLNYDSLHFDLDEKMYEMLEKLPKIKLRHNSIEDVSHKYDKNTNKWILQHNYTHNNRIFESISRNTNLYELDMSMIKHNISSYDLEMLRVVTTNLKLPSQLKIYKLCENLGSFICDNNKFRLNNGLEELYLGELKSLCWIESLPLSLKNIYVKDEYTEEELDRYVKMIPYGCSISVKT